MKVISFVSLTQLSSARLGFHLVSFISNPIGDHEEKARRRRRRPGQESEWRWIICKTILLSWMQISRASERANRAEQAQIGASPLVTCESKCQSASFARSLARLHPHVRSCLLFFSPSVTQTRREEEARQGKKSAHPNLPLIDSNRLMWAFLQVEMRRSASRLGQLAKGAELRREARL